jgi:hypothetical protein
VGAVGLFGELKDKAEEIVERDPKMLEEDVNPSPFKQEAEHFYRALKSSKTLEIMREQLVTCGKGS